jgi:hypothetical protein
MENLKSLVSKANSGFSPRSSSKERFGLGSFIAASTDQMLMIRGGVGHSRLRVGQETGGGPGVDVYAAAFSGMVGTGSSGTGGGPGGAIGNIGNSIAQGFSNMFGSFNDSAAGQVMNGAIESITSAWDRLVPSDIIGVFSDLGGQLFSTQSTGGNADCPPGSSNPKCPNSNPDYQGPY